LHLLARRAIRCGYGALYGGPRFRPWSSWLRAFSLLEHTCRAERLTGATRNEIIARAMHEEYVRKQVDDGQTPQTNPSMVAWEQLPESLREPNRRQADYVPVKLQAIGCASSRSATGGLRRSSCL
jgi:hypothetical protein